MSGGREFLSATTARAAAFRAIVLEQNNNSNNQLVSYNSSPCSCSANRASVVCNTSRHEQQGSFVVSATNSLSAQLKSCSLHFQPAASPVWPPERVHPTDSMTNSVLLPQSRLVLTIVSLTHRRLRVCPRWFKCGMLAHTRCKVASSPDRTGFASLLLVRTTNISHR